MFIKKLLLFMLLGGIVYSQQLRVLVSIVPQIESVKAIGGELVDVLPLVPAGATPENYSPRPVQMREFRKCSLLFTIGAPMEKAVLNKFKASLPDLKVVECERGMIFREMTVEHQHEEAEHGNLDPHAWLSVQNMKIHGKNVLVALKQKLPEHTAVLEKNFQAYIKQLDELETRVNALLSPHKGKSVAVFHPAFAYLLETNGIRQVPVEADGKEPSAKHLAYISKIIKAANANALFVQPQFNRKNVEAMANVLKLKIVILDPLPVEYSRGIEKMAKILARELAAGN